MGKDINIMKRIILTTTILALATLTATAQDKLTYDSVARALSAMKV